MQKITPHLWFDKEAKEAANFYTSVFPGSKVTNITVLRDTPSGDCDVVSFELWGHNFMSISAGPLFQFNPSVSFIVNFDPLFFKASTSPEKEARKTLDQAWERLSEMPPYSCHWINTRLANGMAGCRISTAFPGNSS
jgi:predicted 3-demethylubiquinone-9 3-methyltransferase (glyoxalase superfamily)